MLPWVELGRAKVPGGGEFRLMQRGQEFTIFAGTIGLMSSRQSGSEEAMANIAFERIGGRLKPKVLIGGLGMGFTLRRTLELFGPDAQITLAELVPEIAGTWARGPLAAIHGASLDDPRLTLAVRDVGEVMASDKFDAILLDVDNGPEGLSRPGNDALYSHAGLSRAKAALKPGGLLIVWSVAPDPAFTKRIGQSGLKVEELKARAHGGKGARHVLWVGTKG